MTVNIPTSCRECAYNAICEKSYYGGGLCQYRKAIEEETISHSREHEKQ